MSSDFLIFIFLTLVTITLAVIAMSPINFLLVLFWTWQSWFSNSIFLFLQIPANGFPVNGQLDIAVEFTAPSRPGRYISYWRMASPSGQKFGQRVWVLIQVPITNHHILI